jgi:regulatory protein
MTDIKPSDVRRAVMDLLARREHSRYEILVKLTRRFGDNTELFKQEIGRLTNEGLQSDSRLAEAFIRARTNRGRGPVKIKMELRAKQVDDEIISIAFEECGVDFTALARSVAVKKFGDELGNVADIDMGTLEMGTLGMGTLDMKAKARISRFMQQRGFSYDHISSLY